MSLTARSILLLVAALGVDACASTPEPAPQTAQRTRRRRRRPPAAAAGVTTTTTTTASTATSSTTETATVTIAPDPSGLTLPPTVRRVGAGSFEPRANAPSIGSPVVAPPNAASHPLTPRWTGTRAAPRLVCEGEGSPVRPSTQSPYDPTNAMIVRAFLPVERAVLACRPPMNREGRVPVRMLFSGNGLPIEVNLSADVTRAQGICLGTALCNVHMGAFRAPNATVNYGFVAAVVATEDEPTAPQEE